MDDFLKWSVVVFKFWLCRLFSQIQLVYLLIHYSCVRLYVPFMNLAFAVNVHKIFRDVSSLLIPVCLLYLEIETEKYVCEEAIEPYEVWKQRILAEARQAIARSQSVCPKSPRSKPSKTS